MNYLIVICTWKHIKCSGPRVVALSTCSLFYFWFMGAAITVYYANNSWISWAVMSTWSGSIMYWLLQLQNLNGPWSTPNASISVKMSVMYMKWVQIQQAAPGGCGCHRGACLFWLGTIESRGSSLVATALPSATSTLVLASLWSHIRPGKEQKSLQSATLKQQQ